MLLQRLHQFCINNSQLFPILLGGNEQSRADAQIKERIDAAITRERRDAPMQLSCLCFAGEETLRSLYFAAGAVGLCGGR
jgi:hypothetical protein